MKAVFFGAALALLGSSCVPGGGGPSTLERPFKPVTLAELRANPATFSEEQVVFSATIERVEETPQGIWMHLADGDQKLVIYTPVSFGGAFREQVEKERMQFEVRVGETKLTPLGIPALEVVPYQISKTHYFDEAIPLEEPNDPR